MSLNLKPGELLSELELTEKLNLSRIPIREVIMNLKNEHLIEVKPQSGIYVPLIDIDLIEEATFMIFAQEIISDIEALGEIIENICYNNALKYCKGI